MTELILFLPYWLWALIIFAFVFFISICIGIILTGGEDEEAGFGCGSIIAVLLLTFSLTWFSDLYEENDLESAQSRARNYELQQHRKWTNDSTSFLSERLSARKLMEEKVRQDTERYSPVVAKTIEILENRIKDYQLRIFALKNALIDQDVRQGITSKSEAIRFKNAGAIFHVSTGINEINPDDMSIKEIIKNSPADEAGIAEGDIITEIIRHDGQDWKIMESNDITTLTGNYSYRGNMVLRIRPKEGIRTVGKIGVGWAYSFYGGAPSMTINEVLENRPAEAVGLKVGDEIIKINDSAQLTHTDFSYHFLNLDTIESTKLGIVRDELEMDIIIKNELLKETEYVVQIQVRDIGLMIDDTYSEWVKLTEALKISLERMKQQQKTLYITRRTNELNPTIEDKSEEINKLILEAKKTADRNIKLFKLGESNE
ncbi:PDZ domain-containing protein [Gammaproteobacteria bacterium]|nr:PDZ domain-containing protein [Gammaproteobacteria bacterium]